jgi:hypothetical protein
LNGVEPLRLESPSELSKFVVLLAVLARLGAADDEIDPSQSFVVLLLLLNDDDEGE